MHETELVVQEVRVRATRIFDWADIHVCLQTHALMTATIDNTKVYDYYGGVYAVMPTHGRENSVDYMTNLLRMFGHSQQRHPPYILHCVPGMSRQ